MVVASAPRASAAVIEQIAIASRGSFVVSATATTVAPPTAWFAVPVSVAPTGVAVLTFAVAVVAAGRVRVGLSITAYIAPARGVVGGSRAAATVAVAVSSVITVASRGLCRAKSVGTAEGEGGGRRRKTKNTYTIVPRRAMTASIFSIHGQQKLPTIKTTELWRGT